MRESITFFFPYHDVSGVPVLFLNLAEFICSHFKYDVYIIDYKDGYMANNLNKTSNVKLIQFEKGKLLHISETVLVMQAILPYAMRPELIISGNTKVFFWCLFPDIFFPFVFPFNFIKKNIRKNTKLYQLILNFFYKKTLKKIKEFVIEMNNHKALIFMDSSNLNRTNEILGLKLYTDTYLPISCEGDNQIINKNVPKKNELNISWLGRVCDFKVYILKYTIEKLAELAKNKNKYIVFHLIGNGNEISVIENISVNNEYFTLNIVGVIPKNQLDQYLTDNIDINTAMGTSALESARLGIPTIVLDISYHEIVSDYIFRWLHNTSNYDVGHNITSLDFEDNNMSLEIIIEDFELEKETLKDKSYEYFQNNHSTESVSNKLIQFIELYSFKFDNINNYYFKKSILRKIYEYKQYKIWSK